MLRRHITLLCILTGIVLYGIASAAYPGGSYLDAGTSGYHWYQNYICNVMAPTAMNGSPNPLYLLARLGVAVLAAGMAWFFYDHSLKVPDKNSAKVIRYAGIAAMACNALVFFQHDFFNTPALALSLLTLFYMVVHLFMERRLVLAISGAILLALGYGAVYIYFSQQLLTLLPAIQKLMLIGLLSWILALQYLYKPSHKLFKASRP